MTVDEVTSGAGAATSAHHPVEHPEGRSWVVREVGLALRNAAKLGGSLLFTWAISLVLGLYIPRYLGPARFGVLNFAAAFTSTAFVFLDLGITTYVRKQIAVRPRHASDFVGGVLIFRLALVGFLFLAMEVILRTTHRSSEVRHLVYIFGIAQFFVVASDLSSALLHASGNVNEMSVVAMITKVLWAGGLVAALVFRLNLWAYALAFCFSEGLKSFSLFHYARKHLDLKIRLDARATRQALAGGMPFYVTGIATTVYNRIDVSILGILTTDREVGWYGAAVALAGLTMLLAPIISWVLMPLLSRAAKASEAELFNLGRRSLELILTVAIAVSFLMIVGADIWVRIVFGRAFAPAAMAMRVLTVAHILMYVSMVYWCILTVLNITWRTTAVFLFGLVLNPTLNFLMIRPGLTVVGIGGGGTVAAITTLITELYIVCSLAVMLGRRGMDKRLVAVIAKSTVVAALVICVDTTCLTQLGPLRLVIDVFAYLVVAWLVGAVNLREHVQWVQEIRHRAARRDDLGRGL